MKEPMKLFNLLTNLFSSKSEAQSETKSNGITNVNSDQSFFNPYSFGSNTGLHFLRNLQAWRYYAKISPIFDAVDRKTKAVKTIQPAVYDKEKEVYYHKYERGIPATEILEFLKTPNRDKKWIEFVEACVPSSEVTGDIFILVTAINEQSKPLEFYYINPSDMNYTEGKDGRVYTWQLNSRQFNNKFYYKEEPSKGIASYFSKDGMQELWQIKTFNPSESQGDPFGLSPLNAIMLEIEQYEYSNINNTSVLKKGVRPSGVLVIDKEFNLSDVQYNRMREQMMLSKAGAENAGDVLILEGGKDFKQLSQTNKDMDFVNLIKFVKDQIYVTKGIPLPMISGENMTLNNFEESKYMMFDTDTLPFVDKFYQELSCLFMRRFDNSGRYELCYEAEQVPALKVKRSAMNDKKLKSGVLKVDEGRKLIGYEPLESGEGEVLLVQGSQRTLDQVVNQPEKADDEKSYDYTTPAGRYRLQLEYLTYEDGSQKYSEEEISKKVGFLYPKGK
jgi:HK97 family phage portal protein